MASAKVASAAGLLLAASASWALAGSVRGQPMRAYFLEWLPAQSEEELLSRLQAVRRQGYNSVVTNGRYHFRFEYLDRWPELAAGLARLTKLAHAEGLRVYDHHSAVLVPTANLSQPLADGGTLRDLLQVNADTGEPSQVKPDWAWWICHNNPRYRELYFAYLRLVFTQAPMDGLMCDDIEHLPDERACACRYCRERFRSLTGQDLPAWGDQSFWFNPESALWRQWVRARQTSVGGFYKLVKAELGRLRPGAPLFACQCDALGSGLATTWALADEFIDPAMDIRFWEDLGASEPDPVKAWRGALPQLLYLEDLGGIRKPTLHLPYAHEEGFTARSWAFDRLIGAWTCAFDGAACGPYMQQFVEDPPGPPEVRVAVVYSANSRDLRTAEGHVASAQAWAPALLGAHADLAFLDDARLERSSSLAPYRLIVLPKVVCLSARAVSNLRAALKRGAHLAFTDDSGRYDETGAPRTTGGLTNLLGESRGVRLIPAAPAADREATDLLRWSDAPPLVSVAGGRRALWRLYRCGGGRYQLRTIQPAGQLNDRWLIRVRRADILDANLQRTTGAPLALTVHGGRAEVPAGALTYYGQLDITVRTSGA